MLEFWVTYNISTTAVYNEVIADIQYQIQLLNLKEYFIQKR